MFDWWNSIVALLYKITIHNWGVWLHFIIANQLTTWLAKFWRMQYVAPSVLGALIAYEMYQFAVGTNNGFDFATDMAMNMLGVALAVTAIFWKSKE